MNKEYIAHRREIDGEEQGLETHLTEVGKIAGQLAGKLGVSDAGVLLGLLHDFGKYSQQFQTYIKSATGLINPDEDDYVDAKGLKGKVDHSSAGAQWVWNELHGYGSQGELCAQILALCIASHHSGLIDCLKPEGGNSFVKRIDKEDNKTHLEECTKNAHPEVLAGIRSLATRSMLQTMCEQLQQLVRDHQHNGQQISTKIQHFYIGFWTRFLFSCLIDADRINSADFENPANKQHRRQSAVEWQTAIKRTETYLAALPVKYEIDKVRRSISDECMKKATQPTGIYSLTVPTGGGKTFASLRYALHHQIM